MTFHNVKHAGKRKGHAMSAAAKHKLSGHKMSAATKLKLSASLKGKHHTASHHTAAKHTARLSRGHLTVDRPGSAKHIKGAN